MTQVLRCLLQVETSVWWRKSIRLCSAPWKLRKTFSQGFCKIHNWTSLVWWNRIGRRFRQAALLAPARRCASVKLPAKLSKFPSRRHFRKSKFQWSRGGKLTCTKGAKGRARKCSADDDRQILWIGNKNIPSQVQWSNFRCLNELDCGSRSNSDQSLTSLLIDFWVFPVEESKSVPSCLRKYARMRWLMRWRQIQTATGFVASGSWKINSFDNYWSLKVI